jgi:hypothetical protein
VNYNTARSLSLLQQLRQFGDIRRDPSRLIFAEQLSTADLSARLSLND